MQTVHLPLSALTPDTLKAISYVGRVVTFEDDQYLCHSVEGYDYYAFITGPDEITADFGMSPSEHRRQPRVFLLPMGTSVGDGYGFEVRLSSVRKGVSLTRV